jgi:protein-L-isoaspartate(D-aspartate) O-methyltransferase
MSTLTLANSFLKNIIESGTLKTTSIIEAFRTIDRKDFVREIDKEFAYEDRPLSIGYGQTISQPTTVAFMLELLLAQKGDSILDVGSGSGWTTALLAKIVGNKGRVVGVEIIPQLVESGSNNLAKYNFKNARIIKSQKELGYKEESPYDKVLVSAAANSLPLELVGQLKTGGCLVIPICHSIHKITKLSKDKFDDQEFFGFSFVPLIHKEI